MDVGDTIRPNRMNALPDPSPRVQKGSMSKPFLQPRAPEPRVVAPGGVTAGGVTSPTRRFRLTRSFALVAALVMVLAALLLSACHWYWSLGEM